VADTFDTRRKQNMRVLFCLAPADSTPNKFNLGEGGGLIWDADPISGFSQLSRFFSKDGGHVLFKCSSFLSALPHHAQL
jgi:hypothetical protein